MSDLKIFKKQCWVATGEDAPAVGEAYATEASDNLWPVGKFPLVVRFVEDGDPVGTKLHLADWNNEKTRFVYRSAGARLIRVVVFND